MPLLSNIEDQLLFSSENICLLHYWYLTKTEILSLGILAQLRVTGQKSFQALKFGNRIWNSKCGVIWNRIWINWISTIIWRPWLSCFKNCFVFLFLKHVSLNKQSLKVTYDNRSGERDQNASELKFCEALLTSPWNS